MTSSLRIAVAPKLVQGVVLSDPHGLARPQSQVVWEVKVPSQGRGQTVPGPRAVLASAVDLQTDSSPVSRRGAGQTGLRKPGPDVNGGASISGRGGRVGDRSDARSAAKQVLDRLDNGFADVTNGGRPLGGQEGQRAPVVRRKNGTVLGPKVLRAEAGSEARESSRTPSLRSDDRTAEGGSSSDEGGAIAVVVPRGDQVERPLSSASRRAARRAAKGRGNPAAAGFSSLGATVASSKPSPKPHTVGNTSGAVSDARITSRGAGIALRSDPPPQALRTRGPKTSGVEVADSSRHADISRGPKASVAEVADISTHADISRVEQGQEASSSGAPHHDNAPTVGTLQADRAPPQNPARERPPRWKNVPRNSRRKPLGQPKTGMWKAIGKEPIMSQVVNALQGLSVKGLLLEGAVERAVGKELLAQMDVEKWKEVLRLLAKGDRCAHMEAVLEYMMSLEGCPPDAATFSRVFFTLHRNRQFERALRVFELLRETGLPGATNMYNAAMSAVTKLGGNVPLVEEIFEEMRVRGIPRDKFTYSTVMDAIWQAGIRIVRGRKDRVREATPRERREAADKVEALYLRMVSEGLVPDTVAKNVVLNALVCSEAYARAEAMFSDMCADERMPPNDRTYTIMMHMYSEQKEQEKAQDVFERMLAAGIPPTEITYNVLIRACVGTRNVREAIRLYREMGTRGLPRSCTTLNSLVEVLSSSGYFSQAEQVIYGMEIKGYEPSPEPYNMLITGLVRSRDCLIDEAMRVFQAMQLARVKPWALTFGALMEGFGKTGRLQEMEHTYRLMRYAKLQPTTTIFTAMIHAYVRADDLETSWELFAKMREVGLVPNVQTYTVLIKGLAARGELDVIDDVFREAKEELLELDGVIYEAVILAHVEAKSLSAAERLCQEMAREGVAMNPQTYDKLAAVHTEAGRFDKAEEVWAEKRIAYPDLEERKRASRVAAGWLEIDEKGETKRRRPLVIDDVWAALDGSEELDDGSALEDEDERLLS